MATPKQLELRIKYAKTSVNSLTKKLNVGKAKLKVLEADLKKAKAARGKLPLKKSGTSSGGARKI